MTDRKWKVGEAASRACLCGTSPLLTQARGKPSDGSMRLFPIFVLCLTLIIACGPRPAERVSPAPDPAHPFSAPPVWWVDKGETRVYFFGSAHALTPAAAWRSEALDEALTDAELILFEIAPGAAQSPETLALFADLGANPPGTTLSAQLSPEDAARLRRVAQNLGLPMERLEAMRPWAAAQAIALTSALAQGVRPAWGVEAVLARDLGGRPALGLETPEQQLQVFAGLSPEREGRLLTLTLTQLESDRDRILEAEAAWSRGDSAAIAAMSREAFLALDQAFYEAMITDRNRVFAEAAISRLSGADQDVLIIVGAAHLSGPDGVIAMLRARGYEVQGP